MKTNDGAAESAATGTGSGTGARPQPIRKHLADTPPPPTDYELSKPDAFRLRYLRPEDLKPHPLNAKLYDEREDPEFEQTIKEDEIGQPIVATPALTILSGHWR